MVKHCFLLPMNMVVTNGRFVSNNKGPQLQPHSGLTSSLLTLFKKSTHDSDTYLPIPFEKELRVFPVRHYVQNAILSFGDANAVYVFPR